MIPPIAPVESSSPPVLTLDFVGDVFLGYGVDAGRRYWGWGPLVGGGSCVNMAGDAYVEGGWLAIRPGQHGETEDPNGRSEGVKRKV